MTSSRTATTTALKKSIYVYVEILHEDSKFLNELRRRIALYVTMLHNWEMTITLCFVVQQLMTTS